MISRKNRDRNKSRGPWGLKDYNVTYRKAGDNVERHRFIQSPDEASALEQFEAIMKKEGIEPKNIKIESL
jgi:hypothetical protein